MDSITFDIFKTNAFYEYFGTPCALKLNYFYFLNSLDQELSNERSDIFLSRLEADGNPTVTILLLRSTCQAN